MPYLGAHRRHAAAKRRAVLIAGSLVMAAAVTLAAPPAVTGERDRTGAAAGFADRSHRDAAGSLDAPARRPRGDLAGLGPVANGPGRPVAPGLPGVPGRPGGRATCAVSDRLVPSCGVLWGVAPGAHTDAPGAAALARFEESTGRPQAIYHSYHHDTELFPTAAEAAIARDPAHPRLLLINWKPPRISWARIAAGDSGVDAYLDRLAAHIRRTFPERFFLAVHHEPEEQVRPKAGSGYEARDYRAMYRHVVQRLRARGATNVVTVMIYMAYVKWNAQPWFGDLYPGDDVVDWVAWDAYAYSRPGYGHGDFAELMNRRSPSAPHWPGFYAWASRTFPAKPFMIAEWGVWRSAENSGHQARFFASVARQIGRYPRIKAMVYFNTPRNQQGYDSRVDGTAEGLRAYRSLGADERFRVSPGRRG